MLRVMMSLLFVAAVLCVTASAQTSPFDVTGNADTITPTATHVSGDTWDLDIVVRHSGSQANVDILVNKASGNRPSIRHLTFDIEPDTAVDQLTVTVNILGPTNELDNLHSLGSMTFDPPVFEDCEVPCGPDRRIIIDEMWVFGSVGDIECHGIGSLRIGGDLTGHLHVMSSGTSYAQGFIIEYVDLIRIEGDLTGSIAVVNAVARIGAIEVVGDIGSAMSPVNLSLAYPAGVIGNV
ncbi:MAG: hypothetical protein KF757_01585 [Phycisphaeraceae bacterium]|nr:hypothetical protein [Phycisphaeraceae bacterium]MCW5761902.1 hypothetical protein [Phycisphaeraceae bacterium]